jgi:lipoate-protein ligase A
VLHNSDWTYSLAFPPTHGRFDLSAKESYRRLHESVADAFTSLGVDAWLAEDCLQCGGGCCFSGHERHDVVVAEGKIAGAAQRRTRQGLLIQGSIRPPSAARREDWEKAFLENLGESLRPLDEGGSELGSVRASAIWLRDEKYGKEAFLRRR